MQNEELEPAFRQTAELLDRLGTRLENDPALNRPGPEIGGRYGDHLEATAHSIGELRWQVRENFAQFLHQNLVLLTKPIRLSGNQPSQEVNTLCQPINTIRPTRPSARAVTLKNKFTQLPP